MRRVGLFVGILAGILVLSAAAIWLLVDVNQYRGTIESRLEQQLGRKVRLGSMSLGLLPPRFRVENPVIADDPDFGQLAFIRAEKLDVQVGLISLLRGKINISSFDLYRRSGLDLVQVRRVQAKIQVARLRSIV